MLIITATLLSRHLACSEQVALFRETFGESTLLTPNVWALAQQAGLNVFWCANLLPSTLRAEWEAVSEAVWTTYADKRPHQWGDFDDAAASALYPLLHRLGVAQMGDAS